MKSINLILLCVCLTACATQKYVPIPAKCPAPIIKPEPDYPVRHLTQADKANPGVVVKSYVVSLKQCMVQNKMFRAQLEGYKHD